MAKRPTIETVRYGIGDAMVSNLWTVEFLDPPAQLAGTHGQFLETMNLRAVSAEIPKRTGNSLEITIRGHKVKQPGDYDYSGQITFTLVESDFDSPVHDFIRAWREKIIGTNNGFQFPKSEIEATIVIRRLNRQNGISGSKATAWELRGCYLEDYELGDLSETGDIVQPTMTISYDYFIEVDTPFLAEPEQPYNVG